MRYISWPATAVAIASSILIMPAIALAGGHGYRGMGMNDYQYQYQNQPNYANFVQYEPYQSPYQGYQSQSPAWCMNGYNTYMPCPSTSYYGQGYTSSEMYGYYNYPAQYPVQQYAYSYPTYSYQYYYPTYETPVSYPGTGYDNYNYQSSYQY